MAASLSVRGSYCAEFAAGSVRWRTLSPAEPTAYTKATVMSNGVAMHRYVRQRTESFDATPIMAASWIYARHTDDPPCAFRTFRAFHAYRRIQSAPAALHALPRPLGRCYCRLARASRGDPSRRAV